MLSTSIETRVRGDEATRCNQLAQYRADRLPRSVKNQFVGDVEMLQTPEMANVRKRIHKKFGKYENEDEVNDEEPADGGDDWMPVMVMKNQLRMKMN